ncbi:unnamed protein product [Leptidea sinapis]|uniref:Uncharacterized protein n=1 Tax=Leptidea sinapis TaxID=189913 RepID=A0A5E4QS21_9NEOP|nr:unnamed protein product [Leptidea sinapis]
MNEEIDEYDIYHQDFTTASEWEVFIARLEEIMTDWQLSKSKIPMHNSKYTKKWLTKTEVLCLHGLEFKLTYHHLEPERITKSSESKSDDHFILKEIQNGIWESTKNFMDDVDGSPFPVSNWFCLKRYLMLCPRLPLVDGNIIKSVMSSVNISIANVDCGVPFFVKLREHWQPVYLGLYEDSDYKISFDTVHLKLISSQCSHLTGLVGLFKSKISSPVPLDAVVISVKFSYELKDSDAFVWKEKLHSNEFLSIEGFDVKKLTELPFGSENNPVQSALLNAIWPQFRESAIVDSSTFSDIDPIMAPTWMITIKMRSDLKCQLSAIIEKVMSLLDNNHLLMDTLGLSKSLGLINPLNKITEAPITISKFVKAAMRQTTNVSEFKGPIADDLLMPLLYYVFPDAVEDSVYPFPKQLELENKPYRWEHRILVPGFNAVNESNPSKDRDPDGPGNSLKLFCERSRKARFRSPRIHSGTIFCRVPLRFRFFKEFSKPANARGARLYPTGDICQ